MSISKIRTILYKAGKYLGDLSAVKKAVEKRDFEPILKRIYRRIYGKITGRGFDLFK